MEMNVYNILGRHCDLISATCICGIGCYMYKSFELKHIIINIHVIHMAIMARLLKNNIFFTILGIIFIVVMLTQFHIKLFFNSFCSTSFLC